MAITIPYGNKNNYTTMRDLDQWIESLKLPNILFATSPITDDLTIINTDNKSAQRITRYALEDAADPHLVILEAISNLMAVPIDKLGDIIKQAMTIRPIIYTTDNTTDQWTVNPNGTITRALPHHNTIMHNMPELEVETEQEVHRELLKKRLFTKEEQKELADVKGKVRWHFDKFRLAEEKAIPFNMSSAVIAGGCFVSFLSGEEPNDFDIFFLEDERNHRLTKGMAKSYDFMKSTVVMNEKDAIDGHAFGITLGPNKNDRVRIGTQNYMDNDKIEQTIFFRDSKMQYITTKYKTREELVQHFDFKHCCVSYDYVRDKLYISRETYDLIKRKVLEPNGNNMPKPWRYEKFHSRGWKREITFI